MTCPHPFCVRVAGHGPPCVLEFDSAEESRLRELGKLIALHQEELALLEVERVRLAKRETAAHEWRGR